MNHTQIFVELSFDAAHYLPGVPEGHKCGRMHGHTYRLTLWIGGPVDPGTGWIVDYSVVKAAADPIVAQLDHHTLNNVPGLENPTCEIIAAWIAERVQAADLRPGRLVAVDLRETERAGVRLTCE